MKEECHTNADGARLRVSASLKLGVCVVLFDL